MGINGQSYEIKIKGFICDVPAKSFIKYTKRHTGYYSCPKCNIECSYLEGKMCFPDMMFNIKIVQDFRNKSQTEHHTGTPLLEEIPNIDLIKDFPLDAMHLIYLGVVRKLIDMWCYCKPPSKLSARQIENISISLVALKHNITCNFNKKPRTLHKYKRWKATELRQILLYTAPLSLKAVLSEDMYLNFIYLHVAVTILSNSKLLCNYIDYAEQLLKYFVETFITLYGKHNVFHNVHNLLHLTNDCKRFG